MPLPIIVSALAFAELVPVIRSLLTSAQCKSASQAPLGRTLAIAERIVSIAKQLTQKENPQEAFQLLSKDPSIFLKFQECITTLEKENLVAEMKDRMSARERDLQLISLGRINRRADIMVIAAALGLVGCLVALSCYQNKFSGEAIGILSTIAGVFGACLKDAFSFEFGSTRQTNQEKMKLLQALKDPHQNVGL